MGSTRWNSVTLVAVLLLAGCISLPVLPELPADQLALTERAPRPGLVASLACVQDGIRFQLTCDDTLQRVQELLSKSHWLARVSPNEADPDLRLTVHAPVRRPYWSVPPHNPAVLLLSIAIPFWWSEPFGYRIDATRVETGKTVELDTTYEGTIVFWSAASLFNVMPNRAFTLDEQRELDHLHLQLLTLFSE